MLCNLEPKHRPQIFRHLTYLWEGKIGHAHSIKIDAQAMLGGFLKELERPKGGRPVM
jgi:hypothetical protein